VALVKAMGSEVAAPFTVTVPEAGEATYPVAFVVYEYDPFAMLNTIVAADELTEVPPSVTVQMPPRPMPVSENVTANLAEVPPPLPLLSLSTPAANSPPTTTTTATTTTSTTRMTGAIPRRSSAKR
jgi:hypothetical protein